MLKKDRHKQPVRAVTFDLWETLLFERDGHSARRTLARCRNLADAFNKFGINVSLEQLDRAFKKLISSLLKVWDANKDVSHLDQIQLIVKFTLGHHVVMRKEWMNELSSAYVSSFFEVPPYLNPDARKVFKWLRSHDISIGIICNTGLTLGFGIRRFLEEENIAEYFDVMVFSDEVGIRKPARGIFRLAAQKLEMKPLQVVHVGDNLKSDIWGAKKAGFKGVYFSSEVGRDRLAESDPTSLVWLSRKLGNVRDDQIVPDATITSLAMLPKVINKFQLRMS